MSTGESHLPASLRGAFARFFKSEAMSSILLLICTIVALLWANSPWSGLYLQILHTKIGFSWETRSSRSPCTTGSTMA